MRALSRFIGESKSTEVELGLALDVGALFLIPAACVWSSEGLEFVFMIRVENLGFRVQGSGCRVQGAGFRVQGSRV